MISSISGVQPMFGAAKKQPVLKDYKVMIKGSKTDKAAQAAEMTAFIAKLDKIVEEQKLKGHYTLNDRIDMFSMLAISVSDQLLSHIRRMPEIRSIEEDRINHAIAKPNGRK